MDVSRVRIDDYTPDKKMIATCSVFLDEELCIHHVHIISGKRGIFVAFPNTGEMKMYNRSSHYVSIVHPCNEELRLKIQDAVIDEYNRYSNRLSKSK